MIKAVFFDLDGTLIDSMEDLRVAVNYSLNKCGFPSTEKELFPTYVGNGNRNLIYCCLPENEKTDANVDMVLNEFFAYYGEHCTENTVVFDGIREMLFKLKEMGIKIAVITNKAQAMTERVLKGIFKDFTFDTVYGQREGIPVKPAPDSAFLAMKELSVLPRECLFVGDSKNDMLAGSNSGIKPIGVLWGYRDFNELVENGAYKTIDNPMQLIKEIEAL